LSRTIKTAELAIGDFKQKIEYKTFNKGKMDSKRQEYFSRKNQAKIFDELELGHMLVIQHQAPNIKVKHTVFEAIFGALYILFDMEKTKEFLKNIAILMGYEELS
jgi:dsRNA-specific ribonuclease